MLNVLLPTITLLVILPYAETVVFTYKYLVSPAVKLIIQVIVRVVSLYTPPFEALTKVKPSPNLSATTTSVALTFPVLFTITVYVTLSPKFGTSMLISFPGLISGTVMFLITVLFPTTTLLDKSP